MDIGCSSTKKVNLCFSNENAITNFHKTWYVGSGGTSTTSMVCRHRMYIFIPHLHICSYPPNKGQISRVLYGLQGRNLVCV